MILCVDFDGTLVVHEYPKIGREVPYAVEVLKELIARGDKIILWTMRSGIELEEAVLWCKERGIELYGVNDNPDQLSWTTSRKVFANVYIDDAALGCPLTCSATSVAKRDRDYVEWYSIGQMLLGWPDLFPCEYDDED